MEVLPSQPFLLIRQRFELTTQVEVVELALARFRTPHGQVIAGTLGASVLRAVEVIPCRVRHLFHLADGSAGSSGSQSASSVHPLNVGNRAQNARATGRDLLEQQPGNGALIRDAACSRYTPANHFAATLALPGGTHVVITDFPEIIHLSEQRRYWRNKLPTGAVPSVYLHAYFHS